MPFTPDKTPETPSQLFETAKAQLEIALQADEVVTVYYLVTEDDEGTYTTGGSVSGKIRRHSTQNDRYDVVDPKTHEVLATVVIGPIGPNSKAKYAIRATTA